MLLVFRRIMLPLGVLTLTYQRHTLLEETIKSFLLQGDGPWNMLVLNDDPEVEYVCNAKNVTVVNHPIRFTSLMRKLEFGFSLMKTDYVFRLDDDDLLAPNALVERSKQIEENPGFDLYRSSTTHFWHNRYRGASHNINGGCVYSKKYLESFEWPDMSWGEDRVLNDKAKTYEVETPAMIYRWGGGHYHVSGFGDKSAADIQKLVDKNLRKREKGRIELAPQWPINYWAALH